MRSSDILKHSLIALISMVSSLQLRIPSSIQSMMVELAESMIAAKNSGIQVALAEVPLPVTGGTELDDWPGGIRQKYGTLSMMLLETMRRLDFNPTEMRRREFLGECGAEDSVGYWQDPDRGFQICCFPTIETIPSIVRQIESSQIKETGDLMLLINENFFLGPFSSRDNRKFVESLDSVYHIENLNMKGPRGLSIRGLLYRRFPEPWVVGRRLDNGEYEVIRSCEMRPSR